MTTINEDLEPTGSRSVLLWVLTFTVPIFIGVLILAGTIAAVIWLISVSGGI